MRNWHYVDFGAIIKRKKKKKSWANAIIAIIAFV